MKYIILTVLLLVLGVISTAQAEHCGTAKRENPYLLNKPCSLVLSAAFRDLFDFAGIAEELTRLFLLQKQLAAILGQDCLGLNRLLEKSQSPVRLEPIRQRSDPPLKIETDNNEFDRLMDELIRGKYK